jgi:methionyl-tRNA formyltransferase
LLAAPDVDLAGVVTNPDKPAGRGLALKASPVKARAIDAGLIVQQPASGKDPVLDAWLRDLALDVAVVVAYGRILPGSLLKVPTHGFVNLHFSLLPEYRGAAPVQRAVIEGRPETGVSIMVLTEGMDEGPVVAKERVPIHPTESAGELGERLARIGAGLLPEALRGHVSGAILPQPQDDSKATYAAKITDADARIDWTQPLDRVDALVRGTNPNPGAWTTLRGKRLKVFDLEPAGTEPLLPGELLPGPDLVVGTGTGSARLVDVQPASKRRMSGSELARGLRLASGERLGEDAA